MYEVVIASNVKNDVMEYVEHGLAMRVSRHKNRDSSRFEKFTANGFSVTVEIVGL